MGLNMVGAAVIIPDNSDGTDPENPYGDGEKLLIWMTEIIILISDTGMDSAPANAAFAEW